MSFFDWFRKKKEIAPLEVSELNDGLAEFDPKAHHVLLEYLRTLWEGAPPDPAFEQKTLNRDLHFNTLSMAEVAFAISQERGIAVDKIADFLLCGPPGGGDREVATLLMRIETLAEEFSEAERDSLLLSGAAGGIDEILPIAPRFDTVGFIVKYCRAIELLKDDKVFGYHRRDLALKKSRAERDRHDLGCRDAKHSAEVMTKLPYPTITSVTVHISASSAGRSRTELKELLYEDLDDIDCIVAEDLCRRFVTSCFKALVPGSVKIIYDYGQSVETNADTIEMGDLVAEMLASPPAIQAFNTALMTAVEDIILQIAGEVDDDDCSAVNSYLAECTVQAS